MAIFARRADHMDLLSRVVSLWPPALARHPDLLRGDAVARVLPAAVNAWQHAPAGDRQLLAAAAVGWQRGLHGNVQGAIARCADAIAQDMRRRYDDPTAQIATDIARHATDIARHATPPNLTELAAAVPAPLAGEVLAAARAAKTTEPAVLLCNAVARAWTAGATIAEDVGVVHAVHRIAAATAARTGSTEIGQVGAAQWADQALNLFWRRLTSRIGVPATHALSVSAAAQAAALWPLTVAAHDGGARPPPAQPTTTTGTAANQAPNPAALAAAFDAPATHHPQVRAITTAPHRPPTPPTTPRKHHR
ncbi:MAG: hypothetical protein V7603_5069 [Micromonosporaceae bacterium]